MPKCDRCGYEFDDVSTAFGWAFVRTSILLHLERCGDPAGRDRDTCRLQAARMADDLMSQPPLPLRWTA